jgi:hypothetical protein
MEKAFRVPIEDIFYDFEQELVAIGNIAQVYILKNFPHWCLFFNEFLGIVKF